MQVRRVFLLLFLVRHAVECLLDGLFSAWREIQEQFRHKPVTQTRRLSNVPVAKSTCDPLASKFFDDAIASTLSLHKASSFTAPRKH